MSLVSQKQIAAAEGSLRRGVFCMSPTVFSVLLPDGPNDNLIFFGIHSKASHQFTFGFALDDIVNHIRIAESNSRQVVPIAVFVELDLTRLRAIRILIRHTCDG